MASTEVSVSMGDVVVVKEEGDPADRNKSQVILQLQPMQQGMCEDTAETDAAVVSMETHPDETAGDGEEVEFGYPITCGESKAVLLWKKFVCPGINVKCVKYNEQLISPKQFVHLAGKATLKDWKRAIRLGGVMLRKMMDSGQIDFYQHDQVCTNTCRSTKFDLLINNTRFPGQQSGVVQTPTSPQVLLLCTGNGAQVMVSEERPEEVVEWSQAVTAGVTLATEPESKKDMEDISEETLSFWKGIADVGLMGEVVANIRTELLALLRGVQLRSGQAALQEPDAAVLNNLAQMFGLLDSVKRALENRRSQTHESQEHVHSTLTDLERQLEEQRRQSREWRQRPQPVQNVVLMSLGSSKPPSKRPRLQRPASTTLLSPGVSQQQQQQQQQQQSQQFTVLSPITISSMGQPFTMAGLPVATLAQQSSPVTLHTLPAGSQLFTRYTTSTAGLGGKADTITFHPSSSLTLLSATAVQDPGQLGTMVSPVELVELSQEEEEEEEEEGEEEEGGAGGRNGGQEEGEVVEGAVLVQEGLEEGLGEAEDEGQTHTTVIEIDPAPEHGSEARHHHAVMGLQLAEGAGEEGGVVVQGEMEMGEGEGAGVVVQGEMEEVEGVQIEHQEQLHDVQIVVIEEENADEQEAK
ncbi:glucocorticoid modulatory element-binding protein 1 isoform X2 [Amia ocellicauda]|uniref:glucocorticoid modulatory element-binding protein 1 isoform X2 n=1 Tax=Amia ocellicauda TaxID=2972642 RepID=UPI0034644442